MCSSSSRIAHASRRARILARHVPSRPRSQAMSGDISDASLYWRAPRSAGRRTRAPARKTRVPPADTGAAPPASCPVDRLRRTPGGRTAAPSHQRQQREQRIGLVPARDHGQRVVEPAEVSVEHRLAHVRRRQRRLFVDRRRGIPPPPQQTSARTCGGHGRDCSAAAGSARRAQPPAREPRGIRVDIARGADAERRQHQIRDGQALERSEIRRTFGCRLLEAIEGRVRTPGACADPRSAIPFAPARPRSARRVEYPTLGRWTIHEPYSPSVFRTSPTVTSTVCRETNVPFHASSIICS